MGSEAKVVFITFCLFMSVYPFSLQNTSASDYVKEINSESKRTYAHGTSKIAHGGSGGGESGGRSGGSGGDNGGRTRSDHGGALIPVYTTGAHNHHHSHRNFTSQNCVGLPALIQSALVSLAFAFCTR